MPEPPSRPLRRSLPRRDYSPVLSAGRCRRRQRGVATGAQRQSPCTARLAVVGRVGPATSSVLAAMLAVALLTPHPRLSGGATGAASWFSWTGGFFGAVFVGIAILMVPRLGAATTLALIVVGQMTGALVFDHFGVLGIQQHAASPIRLPARRASFSGWCWFARDDVSRCCPMRVRCRTAGNACTRRSRVVHHHRLAFRVLVDHRTAEFATETRLLHPAERHRVVEQRVAVDPHRAGRDARDQLVDRGRSFDQMLAPRPYGVSLASCTAVSTSSNGIATSTGPKISSRTTRIACVVSTSTVGSTKPGPSIARPPAAARAPSPERVDIAAHALALLRRDERADLRRRVHPRADLQARGDLRDALDHVVEHRRMDVRARPGRAHLPG